MRKDCYLRINKIWHLHFSEEKLAKWPIRVHTATKWQSQETLVSGFWLQKSFQPCLFSMWPWVVMNSLCATLFPFFVSGEVNSDNNSVLGRHSGILGWKEFFELKRSSLLPSRSPDFYFFPSLNDVHFLLIIKYKCSTAIDYCLKTRVVGDYSSNEWPLVKEIRQ